MGVNNRILHRRNQTRGSAPTTAELDHGELAINTVDGIIYTRKYIDGTTINDIIIPVGSTSSAIGKLGYELGTGDATDDTSNAWSPFRTTPNVISEDYTIASGTSASVVGPTIDTGTTITVSTDSVLVIL